MKVTGRRLASAVAGALVATLLATAATAVFAKKPGGDDKDPKPKGAFTIEINVENDPELLVTWYESGTFRASGAIKDRGEAYTWEDEESVLGLDGISVTLRGKGGFATGPSDSNQRLFIYDLIYSPSEDPYYTGHIDAKFILFYYTSSDTYVVRSEGTASAESRSIGWWCYEYAWTLEGVLR